MLMLTSGVPASSAAAIALASVKVLQAAASAFGLSCQHASNTSICASGAIPTIPTLVICDCGDQPRHGGAVPISAGAGRCGAHWPARTNDCSRSDSQVRMPAVHAGVDQGYLYTCALRALMRGGNVE